MPSEEPSKEEILKNVIKRASKIAYMARGGADLFTYNNYGVEQMLALKRKELAEYMDVGDTIPGSNSKEEQ